jgi:hypothetical protein
MGVAVLTLALGQRNAHASLSASVPPAAHLAHCKKSWRVNRTLLDETSQRRRTKNHGMNRQLPER